MSAPNRSNPLLDCRQIYQQESKWLGLFRDFSITPLTFDRQFARAVLPRHILEGGRLQERADRISFFAQVTGKLAGYEVIVDRPDGGGRQEIPMTGLQAGQYMIFARLLQDYVHVIELYDGKAHHDLGHSGAIPQAKALCEAAFPAAWAQDTAAVNPEFNRRLYGPSLDLFFSRAAFGQLTPIIPEQTYTRH
ncbi:MAG TPA: hypothetical protein VF733_01515 [Candidatus Saccharimonadales bacterium]